MSIWGIAPRGSGLGRDGAPAHRRANIAAKAAPTIEFQRQIAFQRLRDKRKQLLFLQYFSSDAAMHRSIP